MLVDLENAFIQALCQKKIWFEGGLECGEDQGKVCVVVPSLYRLRSASAAFCSSLAQALQDLGYQSTKADPMCGFVKLFATMTTSIKSICLC